MGNAIYYCMSNPLTTLRVMRADGEVMEFERPVTAKQLMKTYPGHLVVHCSQVSRSQVLGPRSKVSMMRADDVLQLGQTYCMLRLPTQRDKGLQASKEPDSKASNGVGNGTHEQEQNGVHHRLPPMAALHQQSFGGPWRPHLDSIVESPLSAHTPARGHSVTMSPLARQAGYVPGSVMNSPARTFPSPLRASSSADYRDTGS